MVKRKSNFFFVNFIPIDTNDIIDIHKYLMKGKEYKIMFDLIKKCLWDYSLAWLMHLIIHSVCH